MRLLRRAVLLGGLVAAWSSAGAVGEPTASERLLAIRHQVDMGGQGEAALHAAEAALAELRSIYGERSVEVAEALDTLVHALWVNGRRRDARTLALAESVVQLRTELLGQRHGSLAESRRRLGSLYEAARRFDDAEHEYSEALSIAVEAAGGEEDLVAAAILENSSSLADQRNQRELALELARRSLAIRERLLGVAPQVAASLSTVGNMLFYLGRLAEAEAAYVRAVSTAQQSASTSVPLTEYGDPADLSLFRALHNLALVRHARGDIDAALDGLRRALAISRLAWGEMHHRTGSTRYELGKLERATGDFVAARLDLERARDAMADGYGTDQYTYGLILGELGSLAADEGDLDTAVELQERALANVAGDLAQGHPDIAAARILLAETLLRRGDVARAQSLLEAAAADLRQFSPGAAELPRSLLALAELVELSGDLTTAFRLAEEARATATAVAVDHPLVGRALWVLARIAGRQGSVSQTRDWFAASERLLTGVFGAQHPLVARVELDHAAWLMRSGAPDEAVRLSLAAAAVLHTHVSRGAAILPERQGLLFAASLRSGLEIALDGLRYLGGGTPDLRRDVWRALARDRGLVLESLARRRRLLAESSDPQVERLQGEWLAARQRYANLVVLFGGELSVATQRELLRNAAARADDAEIALARQLGAGQDPDTRLDSALARLVRNQAVISIVRYRSEVGRPYPARTEERYCAFAAVGGSTEVQWIDLGPAEPIEALLRRVADGHYAGSGDPHDALLAKDGEALRRLTWDRLAVALPAAVDAVYVVAEGPLALFDLQTLPIGAGEYLLERGPEIRQLATERALLREATGVANSGLLALAAPDFDGIVQADTVALPEASGGSAVRLDGTMRKSPPLLVAATRSLERCGAFTRRYFDPLPGTVAETETVVGLFRRRSDGAGTDEPIVTLFGTEATEARFKRDAPGKRLIHLATHGFFLGEQCRPGAVSSRASSVGSAVTLSGLALAGANQRRAAAAGDDGVLTAEEVATLDLSGTALIVLSACDTGVGTLSPSEGVLGLRRAFHVAGARDVVVSLGPVDDQAAREWMTYFYEKLLIGGAVTSEAARLASLRALESRRKEGRELHPALWSPFLVTSG